MADTTKIKTVIDPCMRNWLSEQFHGHVFKETPLRPTTGKSYTFDAVVG